MPLSDPSSTDTSAASAPATAASGPAHTWFPFLAWLLCTALYLHTANGVDIRHTDRKNAWHHYEYLVDGYLSGHLYLSLDPAPELLALPDPYDPETNSLYRLWDASLYRGKYYLYYGPTPALLLMLPWRVITGEHLPQRLATGIFAAVGLAAITLLLTQVRRRYFPPVTAVQLFCVVVLAGHLSWLPVILRRPAFWELPIVTAAALFWWSLYFLWRFHEGSGRRRWAVAAGVTLAFVLGARPTYVFTAGAVVALFAWPSTALPQGLGPRLRWAWLRLWPAALPVAVGVCGLLLYNYERFGALFEFGQRYQLWGMDERNVSHFSLGYAAFNLTLYLFSIPQFSPYFPFVRTSLGADAPAGYIATEEIHGILFAMPAAIFGVIALARVWRPATGPEPLRVLVAGAALASLLAAGILCCFAGACSRYIAEAMAGWTIVAAIGATAWFADGERRGRIARWGGALLIGWTLIYVWLASFEFRAFARTTEPKVYATVARILNYPSYWVARRNHQVFGPIAMEVRLASDHKPGVTVLAADGRLGETNQFTIVRMNDGTVVFRLSVNNQAPSITPPFRPDGDVLVVAFEAPWLYPPAAHPYWDEYPADEREFHQTVYLIEFKGIQYMRQLPWSYDAMRFKPAMRTTPSPNDIAWIQRSWRFDPLHMPRPRALESASPHPLQP